MILRITYIYFPLGSTYTWQVLPWTGIVFYTWIDDQVVVFIFSSGFYGVTRYLHNIGLKCQDDRLGAVVDPHFG